MMKTLLQLNCSVLISKNYNYTVCSWFDNFSLFEDSQHPLVSSLPCKEGFTPRLLYFDTTGQAKTVIGFKMFQMLDSGYQNPLWLSSDATSPRSETPFLRHATMDNPVIQWWISSKKPPWRRWTSCSSGIRNGQQPLSDKLFQVLKMMVGSKYTDLFSLTFHRAVNARYFIRSFNLM